jgi:hypothetical protein
MDCGDYGRCIVLNGTRALPATAAAAAAAAGQYACECECGYTADPATGRCDVAQGFCPLYGSSSGSGNIVLLSNTSRSAGSDSGGSSSSCTGSDSVASAAGTCPPKYGFDVFTKTCSRCDDGWGGPACKQCSTDEACKVRGCDMPQGSKRGGHV